MTWTRLSDDFADHPDLALLTRSARLLFVEILVYGNRHGNDGRFRRGLVARMTDAEDWPDLVDELVKREVVDDLGDGLLEVDWPAWNQEPAEAVRERREAHAEAQRVYRERGRRHRAGDHSMCTSRCPSRSREASREESRETSREESRETSRDESRDPLPSRPVPSRPKERERDGRDTSGPGSADAPPDPDEFRPRDDSPWSRGAVPTLNGVPITTGRR